MIEYYVTELVEASVVFILDREFWLAIIVGGFTLAGTILGFVLNEFSKRSKIGITIHSISFDWQALVDSGFSPPSEKILKTVSLEDADFFVVSLTLTFYNSSTENASASNLHISLYNGKRRLVSADFQHEKTLEKITPINLNGGLSSDIIGIHPVHFPKEESFKSNRILVEFFNHKGKLKRLNVKKYKDVRKLVGNN